MDFPGEEVHWNGLQLFPLNAARMWIYWLSERVPITARAHESYFGYSGHGTITFISSHDVIVTYLMSPPSQICGDQPLL